MRLPWDFIQSAGSESELAAGGAADDPAETAAGGRAGEFDNHLGFGIEEDRCFTPGTDEAQMSAGFLAEKGFETLREIATELRAFAKDRV